MSLQPRQRRFSLRSARSLILATYVVVVATLPLLHHDIACHVQSSTHCTICLVGSADKAPDCDALSAAQLVLIAYLGFEATGFRGPILAGDLLGRSPPVLL